MTTLLDIFRAALLDDLAYKILFYTFIKIKQNENEESLTQVNQS